jgi:RNA-directed DNA polymerase
MSRRGFSAWIPVTEIAASGGPKPGCLKSLQVILPDLLSNRAKEVTRCGRYTYIEYARFADDLVILVDGYRQWKWLGQAVYQRLLEEVAKLDVQINTEKTRQGDLTGGESFGFISSVEIPCKRRPPYPK